jgi:hypothetical protein
MCENQRKEEKTCCVCSNQYLSVSVFFFLSLHVLPGVFHCKLIGSNHKGNRGGHNHIVKIFIFCFTLL